MVLGGRKCSPYIFPFGKSDLQKITMTKKKIPVNYGLVILFPLIKKKLFQPVVSIRIEIEADWKAVKRLVLPAPILVLNRISLFMAQ